MVWKKLIKPCVYCQRSLGLQESLTLNEFHFISVGFKKTARKFTFIEKLEERSRTFPPAKFIWRKERRKFHLKFVGTPVPETEAQQAPKTEAQPAEAAIIPDQW